MTRDQRALLQPHAKYFATMVGGLSELTDEELAELLDACQAASQTNCGWDTYAAARFLAPEILTEQTVRARRRAEAAKQGG